jgi:hypothetical protein
VAASKVAEGFAGEGVCDTGTSRTAQPVPSFRLPHPYQKKLACSISSNRMQRPSGVKLYKFRCTNARADATAQPDDARRAAFERATACARGTVFRGVGQHFALFEQFHIAVNTV